MKKYSYHDFHYFLYSHILYPNFSFKSKIPRYYKSYGPPRKEYVWNTIICQFKRNSYLKINHECKVKQPYHVVKYTYDY